MITVEKINELKQKIESGTPPRDFVSGLIQEHIKERSSETAFQSVIFTHTVTALVHRLKDTAIQGLNNVIDELNNPDKINAKKVSELPKIKIDPIKSSDICILYKKFVRPDFFKNTFKATEKDFNIPIFYLKYDNIDIPQAIPFDLNNTEFKKAILWQDNYYTIWGSTENYYPIISGNRCIGPLTIDLEKFKEKYTDIIKYDDISFGYLKETNSFIEGRDPDTYEMDSKVCCRKKREYFNKKVVSVEDGGIPYIDSLPSLKKKIKGE